jgi:hypothetical protein
MLIEMGIIPVIPSKENEDRSARLVNFDKEKYRQRNIFERLIGWLKECRRVFSRYEKTAINFSRYHQYGDHPAIPEDRYIMTLGTMPSHSEAIRAYREVERRGKAELEVIRNAKGKMLRRMLGGA